MMLAFAVALPVLLWRDVTLLGTPAWNGRHLSFTERGDLAVRPISGGPAKKLTTRPKGSTEFAYFSAMARDGKSVAYAWFNADGFYDLRVADVDTGQSRLLYRNQEAGFVQPCSWTPDGKAILTLFFRKDNTSQIALVPVQGGLPKVLKTLSWVYPKKMDLSPDGTQIVYDSFAADGSPDRTLYLLSADGARERKLIDQPGNALFAVWMPDGKSILYLSDRNGTMDAWRMSVSDPASPTLVQRDLGRALPLGFTQSGELYYGVRSGSSDVFLTTLAHPTRDAVRISLRFPNRNTAPAFSHDGKRIAFLSRRGTENFGQESRVVVIRDLVSDKETEIDPKMAFIDRVAFLAEDRALVLAGSDAKGRAGLFSIDLTTNRTRPLHVTPVGPFRGFPFALTPTGLVYLPDQRELRNSAGQTLFRGKRLSLLAASKSGELAVYEDGHIVLPLTGGRIAFDGATELLFDDALYAARGPDIFRIPLNGDTPVKIEMPGNREPGFSLSSGRLALTAGHRSEEIWMLKP